MFLHQMEVRPGQHRFPFCLVWTPIPLITWLFPVIGHIGIATSKGVIRDFAGTNFVSEDDMAFGWPTLYWQLLPDKIEGGTDNWDQAIAEACKEYKSHMHNLCFDNCHSHVARALNTMHYNGKTNWNMFSVGVNVILRGKFVGIGGFLRQYLPFLLILTIGIVILLLFV